MGQGDTLVNALVGAVVTVVLSFTGVSPLLGGGVAGYLQRGERAGGARVGALSGLLATVPYVALFWAFFAFVLSTPMTDGRMGGGMGVPGSLGAFFLFAFVFALAWNVALSAAGGYLGVALATETDASGRGPSRER